MIVILDGNNLASRAYYACGELKTSYGKITNCTYGFLNSFRKIYNQYKSKNTSFYIAWDGPGKKRAHKLYSDYKGDRKGMPDEYYGQLDDIREILSALDVFQYLLEGVEADDIIGTLTFNARKKGHKVLIISADHDFEQEISNHVTVSKPAMGKFPEEIKGPEWVKKKYNLKPCQLVELMALKGDSSDHVPGVEGIGDKKGSDLINANWSLENIINNVDDLKTLNRKGEIVDASKKLKEKIKDNLDVVKRNKEIVKLDHNLDIHIDFSLRKKPDFDKLYLSFEKYEFNKYLENFDKWKCDLML